MLADLYPPLLGGTEMYIQSLSSRLTGTGHRVSICTMAQRGLPGYEWEGEIKIQRLEGLFPKIPYIFKDPGRKWHAPARDWLIGKKLSQIIKEEKPDIIHTHGWMLYSLPLLKKDFSVPIVHTLHDYRLFCPKMLLVKKDAICDTRGVIECLACMRHPHGLVRALFAYYGVKLNRDRLRSVDKFIAVSSFVKQAHIKHLGIGEGDMLTIPSICNTVDEVHEGVEYFPDDFILFTGWLMPHKGVGVLIEAYRKLNTEVKLLILGIGHPAYRYQSTENILVLRDVQHDRVLEAMSKCRFAVVPSICAESFGLVATEAMSQGKAVIASDIGGLSETVVHGETGILTSPGNADELAEAMARLLRDPVLASGMGDKGYNRFIEKYSPDVVVPKIIDVYRSLV